MARRAAPRPSRGAASKSWSMQRFPTISAFDLPADHITEQLPGLTCELHELQLFDRCEVRRARIDYNSR